MSDDTGSVVTVTGRIDPDELGVTLPHEHVFMNNVGSKFEPPESAYERKLANEPLSLENLWWVRKNPTDHKDNLRLDSYEDAVEEVGRYHRYGGSTIVDVTPKNTAGDPEMVRAVARETGVQFVHGTAFYVKEAHPPRVADATVEDLAEEFVSDVRSGIGDTDVRAGIIGEIGCTDHVNPDEEKVLRAGARAALRTGASVSVHTPFQRSEEEPTSRRALDVLDVLEEEGLPPERVILCHRDQSRYLETDLQYQTEIAERGAYVEFDLFGHDPIYWEQVSDAQPSDLDRIAWVEELVDRGHADRLLLSHDIYVKYVLATYGGFGYAHILQNIVPVLKDRGMDQETIDEMLVENPARVLPFTEPAG